MPYGEVTVYGAPNRDLFLNGLYKKRWGSTNHLGVSDPPLTVKFSSHVIETIDKNKKPDSRAEVIVNKNNPNPTVTLEAVK